MDRQSRKGLKISKGFRKRVFRLRLEGYARQGERTTFSKGFVSTEARSEEKINLMTFFVVKMIFVSPRLREKIKDLEF